MKADQRSGAGFCGFDDGQKFGDKTCGCSKYWLEVFGS
jgi:hypothetical protein